MDSNVIKWPKHYQLHLLVAIHTAERANGGWKLLMQLHVGKASGSRSTQDTRSQGMKYKHFLFKYFLFTNYTHWFCIVINMIIILKWYFDIILRLYRPRPPQITCAVLSIKILPITCLGKQIVLDFWSADQHFTESTLLLERNSDRR